MSPASGIRTPALNGGLCGAAFQALPAPDLQLFVHHCTQMCTAAKLMNSKLILIFSSPLRGNISLIKLGVLFFFLAAHLSQMGKKSIIPWGNEKYLKLTQL